MCTGQPLRSTQRQKHTYIYARNTPIQARTPSVDASRERVTCTQSHQRRLQQECILLHSRLQQSATARRLKPNTCWLSLAVQTPTRQLLQVHTFDNQAAGNRSPPHAPTLQETAGQEQTTAAAGSWVQEMHTYIQTDRQTARTAYHTVLDSDECSRGLTQPHASSVHCLSHRKNPRAPTTVGTQRAPPVYWPDCSPLREVGLHYTHNGITPQSTIQRAIPPHMPANNHLPEVSEHKRI